MKINIIFIITTICTLFGGTCILSTQDVEGIETGTYMNRSQIILTFGEPDYIEVHESCDGMDEHYYYNDSYLHFENNVFIGFCLRDPRFIALKKLTDTGIKVGDSLFELNDFKYGKPTFHQEGKYVLFEESDTPVYLLVEDEIIIGIDYHDPV